MIAHRLNRALQVMRPTYVDDGAGGRTMTLVDAGTIRVQVSQPTAQERVLGDQAGARLTHVVHTTYGADVARDDELVGALPSATLGRLRVLAVISDSRSTYKRVECEAVQSG